MGDEKHCCKWCWHCFINSDNKTGHCDADVGDFIQDINKDCCDCPNYDYDENLERYQKGSLEI